MSEWRSAVCKATKVCFQMMNDFVPQLCHQHWMYQDESKERTDNCEVATATKLSQYPDVLGFVNFYWKFIQKYLVIVVPLTDLLKSSENSWERGPFSLMPTVRKVFCELQEAFSEGQSSTTTTQNVEYVQRWMHQNMLLEQFCCSCWTIVGT